MRAALLGMAIVLAAACHKPDDSKAELTSAKTETPVQAQTAKVGEEPMPEYLTLTGTLRASDESDVAANASGKVTATRESAADERRSIIARTAGARLGGLRG